MTERQCEQLGRKPVVHILMGGLLCFLMNRMRRARKMAVRARLRWKQSAVCATSREINTQIFPDRGDLQTFSFQLRRGGLAGAPGWLWESGSQ